jgi:sugar phosphate permease
VAVHVVTSSERLAPLQALTYFCIYVVRQGVTSWFVFYLMKVRRLAHLSC